MPGARRFWKKKTSGPRDFTNPHFRSIGLGHLIEEETNSCYKPEEFYPVRIGEVYDSKYQVVGKLGYGTNSTAWLCRRLA
jgi:serine/threonine-protein kinase SRPK3